MIKIKNNNLEILTKKNNYFGFLWLFSHFALLFIAFSLSIYFLNINNFFFFLIFYLVAGLVASFTGFCGATHEFYHNTVFENKNLNKFFYRFLCIFNFINYEYSGISHKLHHKFNSHDETDSEKSLEKISYIDLILNLTINFNVLINRIKFLTLNAIGKFPVSITNNWIATSVIIKKNIVNAARIIIFYYFVTILIALYFGILKIYLLFFILPFVMNFWLDMISRAQHYGLEKNSDDILKTTRTVYLNKFLSFLNWNMNYHIEHHLYPMVPFYNLSKLNILINNKTEKTYKNDLSEFIKILFRDNFLTIKN